MGLLLVAVPDDERTSALRAAAARAEVSCVVVPWIQAIAAPEAVHDALGRGGRLRIDSPGSDEATWRALARLGGGAADQPPWAWRPGRAWAKGLHRAMRALPPSDHPADTTRDMCDKLACRQVLAACSVPIPPGEEAPDTPTALRSRLDDLGWTSVFVKARWSSAAAGVVAWRRGRSREVAWTPLTLREGRPAPMKRLTRHTDPAVIDAILAPLLADGAIVERWIPKVGADDGPFDLRFVVLDGRVVARVGRVGAGPITNLHLGARRADPSDLLPASARMAAERAAVEAAAAFPGHRGLGVDVAVDARGRPWVLECNAWGDNVRRPEVWDATLAAMGLAAESAP